MADRSEAGWLTVQEYIPDELASDSDDSKRMRQADARATKKRKMQNKPSASFSSAAQYQKFNVSRNQRLFNNQFRNAPQQTTKPGWTPLQPNNFGRFQHTTNICYNCGEPGHWKHSCPKKNITMQSQQ